MKTNRIYLSITLTILLAVKINGQISCDEDADDQKVDIIKTEGVQKKNSSKSLVERFLSKFKIYYGDNDRPVTNKLTDIKSYLKRFGYVDYVKGLFRKSIKERASTHKRNRQQKNVRFRITFGQLLRDDIKSMADVVNTAIKVFQKFMRIKVTGLGDKMTLLKMNKPRCAGKDLGEQKVKPTYMFLKKKFLKNLASLNILKRFNKTKTASNRTKRHTLAGSRWTVTHITYKITKYPTVYRNRRQLIDEQIALALKFWSDVTPLVFIRMPAHTPAKDVIIDIRFERGEHGDGDPLDGVGKVLAHSYFPQYGGDAHFDDDEIWTINSATGSNILITAIHEFGHSLGLDHSDVTESIMNPVYPPYVPEKAIELAQDDIRAVQILYGSKTGVPDVPNLCSNTSVDAMHKELNSCAILVFKGEHYWKIKSDEMKIDSRYPRHINELFREIKSHIDACIQLPDLSHIIFKGEFIYKYDNNLELVDGFPVKIKKLFSGLPVTVDTAIQLDGIIYGFRGNMVWRHTIGAIKQTPGPFNINSIWPGVPPHIDSVMNVKNVIYFFKDQGFYRFNYVDTKFKQISGEPPYPRKTSLWWFGCL